MLFFSEDRDNIFHSKLFKINRPQGITYGHRRFIPHIYDAKKKKTFISMQHILQLTIKGRR
jgi:hypothetical protein